MNIYIYKYKSKLNILVYNLGSSLFLANYGPLGSAPQVSQGTQVHQRLLRQDSSLMPPFRKLPQHINTARRGGGIVTSALENTWRDWCWHLVWAWKHNLQLRFDERRKALRVLGQDFLPQIVSDKMALLQKRWQRCNELSFWLWLTGDSHSQFVHNKSI